MLVPLFALAVRLWIRRPRWPRPDTLRGELNHLLARRRMQERLLASIKWWYILPLVVAGALICYYHFGLTFTHWRGRDLYFWSLFIIVMYCYHRYVAAETQRLQLERLLDLCREWDQLAHGDASEWGDLDEPR